MSATIDDVSRAADTISRQFSRDGVAVQIVNFDNDSLEVELDYRDVECMDCVMPADYLCSMMASSVHRQLGRELSVTLRDPRQHEAVTVLPRASRPRAASHEEGLVVLDPTCQRRDSDPDPGPPAGPLKGKTVGFRVDELWEAFDWVVDEWSSALRNAGAEVKYWRRLQGIPGESGAQAQQDYLSFVNSIDVLISGLGNCGSCTAWTVKDALVGLNIGLPTMAVATAQFEDVARLSAEHGARPGLRLHVLPYPLQTQPEERVRAIAREGLPTALATLGAQV